MAVVSGETTPRRTKLVCTIGPATSQTETQVQLIRSGLDVARLNFSHGTHETHREVYDSIRHAEAEVGKPVAVLQDLQGPKIRLGRLGQAVTLSPGDALVLSSRNDFIGESGRLPTTYERLAEDVRVGEPILLADGRLHLDIQRIDGTDVHTTVKVGGVVSSGKGINLPGTQISVPSLSDKDLRDLEFGLNLGVDYVALSFVRTPHDILMLREQMRRLGRIVPIVSKIEKPQAVQYLEGIVDEGDGIMVARGDLGVELPPEQVPRVQRQAIKLARGRAKISIVATQMLMSMVEHARPTHAEVSDVANAVFDGADAVMLSDETAMGQYPIRTVEIMAALAQAAERSADARSAPEFVDAIRNSHAWAISRAAVVTAQETRAAAIVSYTQFGLGPRLIGTWRPPSDILGCGTSDEELRRMALYWGVRGVKIPVPDSIESLVASVEQAALDSKLLQEGDTVIITSKMPFTDDEVTNMLKIHAIRRFGRSNRPDTTDRAVD
ncbi:MAG: pyruvate kinase [Myxococcota bacterium]